MAKFTSAQVEDLLSTGATFSKETYLAFLPSLPTLEHYPKSVYRDRQLQRAAVRADGNNIRLLKREKGYDDELKMLAVQSVGTSIQFLSKKERTLELRLAAIAQNPWAFVELRPRERREEELKRLVFYRWPNVVRYLTNQERNDVIWRQLEEERLQSFVTAARYSKEERLRMLRVDPSNVFCFAADALVEEEVQELVISRCDASLLQSKFSSIAVTPKLKAKLVCRLSRLMGTKDDTILYGNWLEDDFDLNLTIVQTKPRALRYLPARWRANECIQLAAIAGDAYMIHMVDRSQLSHDFLLKAVKANDRVMDYLLYSDYPGDKELVLAAVERCEVSPKVYATSFGFVCTNGLRTILCSLGSNVQLRDDPQLQEALLRKYPRFIYQYLPEEKQNDLGVKLTAVRADPGIMLQWTREQRGPRQVRLEAVKYDGDAITWIHPDDRDEEIYTTAVTSEISTSRSYNYRILEQVPKQHRTFAMYASVISNCKAHKFLCFAGEFTEALWLMAIRKSPYVFNWIPSDKRTYLTILYAQEYAFLTENVAADRFHFIARFTLETFPCIFKNDFEVYSILQSSHDYINIVS